MFDKLVSGGWRGSPSDLTVNSCEMDVDGIGTVRFHRSRRARRVIISVSPTAGVRVSVPRRTSFLKALEFVETKTRWIQKHLALVAQNEQRRQALGQALVIVDKAAAKNQLIDRLNRLAALHGFNCSRVTVRQQKTRWGSCSRKIPSASISSWRSFLRSCVITSYCMSWCIPAYIITAAGSGPNWINMCRRAKPWPGASGQMKWCYCSKFANLMTCGPTTTIHVRLKPAISRSSRPA